MVWAHAGLTITKHRRGTSLHSGTFTAHYAKSMNSTLDEPLVITTNGGGQVVATAREEKVCVTVPVTHTLTAEGADASEDGTGRGQPITYEGVGVRRLTPLEAERLQGFPDGWTLGESDSARYRMLGNAVAVPVVEWIAKRLVEVDERMEPGQRREGDSQSS